MHAHPIQPYALGETNFPSQVVSYSPAAPEGKLPHFRSLTVQCRASLRPLTQPA